MANELLDGFGPHCKGPQQRQSEGVMLLQQQQQINTVEEGGTLMVVRYYTCEVCLAKTCTCK